MKTPKRIAQFREAMDDIAHHRARSANPQAKTARDVPRLGLLARRALLHPSPLAVDRLGQAIASEKRPTGAKVEAVAVILDLGYAIDPMTEAERRREANRPAPRKPAAPKPPKERLKARHVEL